MSPAVSVVICAYTTERWPLVVRAVASVLRQRHRVDEIVLVVDHNPRLADAARTHWADAQSRQPPVHVVENRYARGLSGARNTGLDLARAPIVAFIDDDAEAEQAWIESLVATYADERVVASGGAVLAEDSVPRPSWWPREFDWVVGCSYVGLPTGRAEIRNPIGANMSVRREAARAVDGFPEGVGRIGSRPFGCEETELCIRLRQRWPLARIVYEPSAVVRHFVPQDRLTWRYFASRCYSEGISKARVAAHVGSDAALASERSYASKVLPQAVVAALSAAWHGERGAARRALAITAGLALTTIGYARGRLPRRRTAVRPALATS